MIRRQHFVKFLSPGTFFDEETTSPIESWDTKTAAKMAAKISERHGSKPYGFVFSTQIVADPVPDGEGGYLQVAGKQVATSGTHYIAGKLVRFDEVQPSTLRSNMHGNGWWVVCETTNSYRHTGIFTGDDVLVDAVGVVVATGKDADVVAYRRLKDAEKAAE